MQLCDFLLFLLLYTDNRLIKKTERKKLSLGECGGRKDLRGTGERKVV